MTSSQMNVRVRVVKCPRCSNLLPEMEDVPVYECGGCGVLLKAKIRKHESKDTELQTSDRTQGNDPRDEGPDGLNQRKTVPSSNESAVDQISAERLSDFVEHNEEKINGFHHSNVLHSTSDHEDPGLSIEARPNMEPDENNCVDNTERSVEDDCGEESLSRRASPSTEPVKASPSTEPGEASPSAEPSEASPSTEPSKASLLTELSEAPPSTEVGEAEPSIEGTDGLNQKNESAVDQSNAEKLSDSVDHNEEKMNGFQYSNELHSTSDHEDPVLSIEARPNMEPDENNCLDQIERRDEDDCGENFSRQASPSSELGKASPSAEPNKASPLTELSEAPPSAERHNALHSTELSEVLSSAEVGEADLGDASSSFKKGEADEPSTDLIHHETESLLPLAGADIEVKASKSLEQNDEWNQNEFEEEDSERDDNLKKHPNSKSTSEESLLGSSQMHSFDTARKSFSGCILACDHGSPLKEQIYQRQNSDYQAHGRVSSTDTGEALPTTEPIHREKESSSPLAARNFEVNRSKSFEQNNEGDQSESEEADTEADENFKRRPIYKSLSEDSLLGSSKMHSFATARGSFADSILTLSPPREHIYHGQNSLFGVHGRVSSTDTLNVMHNNISKSPTTKSYHAYYGSESSCNENEYRAHGRHLYGPKRNFKDKELVSPNGLAQGEEITIKHYPLKGNRWHQDEFVESTSELPRVPPYPRVPLYPRAPLYPRGSQVGPSTYGQNKFDYNSMYKHEQPDTNKIELLKMVSELQDQLDRKYGSVESANRKYDQGRNWSQPVMANRVAFSGEAGHFRHQVDCSCLRCLPQERHNSAQLPRRMTHQSSDYYNSPYRSNSPSPVHFTGSEFSSWSRDNDQWHKGRELKKSTSSQRHQPVKRHCRPVARGSPIIACYKCSALLQLPADFFVFRRRFHMVRCSKCSTVLKFSVRDRVHLVRCLPDPAVAPPPSEVDEYKKRNLALASASRVSEPISSSIDYGPSSTEGEDSSPFVPSFHSPANSFEPVEERNRKGSSTKNQKLGSRKNGSALHRLMGYASPSKVWRVDSNGL